MVCFPSLWPPLARLAIPFRTHNPYSQTLLDLDRHSSTMSTPTLILPDVREPCFDASLPDSPLGGYTKSQEKPVTTPFGGKLLWVGNATCILEVDGIRFMTDPNFLHQGKRVYWSRRDER